MVLAENLPEMKLLRDAKRAELFAVPAGAQKITGFVLMVYGLQGQLEIKE